MATLVYRRTKGEQLDYLITADRHGSMQITLGGKVLKRVTVPQDYYGKPRWGTKKLEADAIEEAKAWIEAMKTDQG